jgi:hypothetical protein
MLVMFDINTMYTVYPAYSFFWCSMVETSTFQRTQMSLTETGRVSEMLGLTENKKFWEELIA